MADFEQKIPVCRRMTPENQELLAIGLPMVRRMACGIISRLPPWVELEDLIAAGNEGLLRAIRDYKPELYPRFEPYAGKKIRSAFFDELRSYDSLTRYGRGRLSVIQRARRALARGLDRAPSDEETARALGVTLERYRLQMANLQQWPGLQGFSSIPVDSARSDDESPEDACVTEDLRERVAKALTQLPERKRHVVELYFDGGLKQSEIGRALGMTESRVCQVIREATTAIRESLEDEEPAREVARALAGAAVGAIAPASVRTTSWAASWPQRRLLSPCAGAGACGA